MQLSNTMLDDLRIKIKKIREGSDLVKIIQESGVALRHISNEDWIGLCPFHAEGTPSFRVSKYRFKCFGCGAGGDVLDWHKRTQRKNLLELVQANISSHSHIEVNLQPKSLKIFSEFDSAQVRKIKQVNKIVWELMRVDYKAANWTHRVSERAFKRFGLGFMKDDFMELMKEKGIGLDALIEAGLAKQSTQGLFIPLRNRITIPLTNKAGHILGFAGRAIGDAQPKYLNPSNTAAFQRRNFLFGWPTFSNKNTRVSLVEGFFDVISLWDKGFTNVFACMGTSVNQGQISQLEHYFTDISVMFDGDRPGYEASIVVSKQLKNASIFLLPQGSDPDSLCRSQSMEALDDYPHFQYSDIGKPFISVWGLMAKVDRSKLDELFGPYVRDNIKQGYPHYNLIDWVVLAYPQYADEINEAIRLLKTDVMIRQDESAELKEEHIKRLLKAWIKPCRDVRREKLDGQN